MDAKVKLAQKKTRLHMQELSEICNESTFPLSHEGPWGLPCFSLQVCVNVRDVCRAKTIFFLLFLAFY